MLIRTAGAPATPVSSHLPALAATMPLSVAANNAEAVQACMNGENYQSQPMSDGEKAGIIIGTIAVALVAIGSAAAPFVQPMIQQFMPR